MKTIKLEQGTQEWRDFRNKGIGASDASIIMGESPWRTPKQLWQEKLGLIPPQFVNSSMQRGIMLEPAARACYIHMTGIEIEPAVMIHPLVEWCFASLDGISLDEKTIVEIKCTSKRNHYLAKSGQIPLYYKAQLQHQMMVTNLLECHYFSFYGGEGIIVREGRNDDYIEILFEKEQEFYDCMMYLEEP